MEDSNPDITLDLPDELHDWILRTQNITLEIRKSAFRFLEIELKPKFETVFGATSKRVRVELESERNRLFCGIGLAALAAIRLAQPSNVERLHRAWFAMLGQTYTNQFNSWRSHQ